jgi:hypothetical protein
MSTTTDPFKDTISAHLQELGTKDALFAETLKKPNKNIDSCINYIYSEVKKTGRCSFNNDEIFNIAIHYYDEDDIKEVAKIQRPQVSQTPEKRKEQPKMEALKNIITKELQKPLKNKSSKKEKTISFVQTSLFD